MKSTVKNGNYRLPLRRYLQEGGRTIFKSETTIRSHLVRPKDAVDPAKQDGAVYRIPCECGKVYIGETARQIQHRIKEHGLVAAQVKLIDRNTRSI